jgi:hypothetical protein
MYRLQNTKIEHTGQSVKTIHYIREAIKYTICVSICTMIDLLWSKSRKSGPDRVFLGSCCYSNSTRRLRYQHLDYKCITGMTVLSYCVTIVLQYISTLCYSRILVLVSNELDHSIVTHCDTCQQCVYYSVYNNWTWPSEEPHVTV